MANRKKSTEDKYKDRRVRNWTFVTYPESVPEDWREMLDATHAKWIESPLHEFDTDPNGEIKKAHWHILMLFRNKMSYEQVKEITDSLNAPIPQECKEVIGMVRYFCHLDNPEKHQYDPNQLVGHNGADVAEYLKGSTAEKHETIGEILDFVIAERVTHFVDLMAYAKMHRRHDWYPVICSNTIVIREIVKSNWQKLSGGQAHA